MGGYTIRGALGRWPVAIALGTTLAGCALFRPSPPVPAAPALEKPPPVIGVASWYGPGFNGRKTASGEVYRQEELTAASTVFPLGSRVMVTNLDNGRSVEVTINDRGPFKKGRKLDLSKKAARVLGMLDNGTARVEMDLLSAPPGSRPVGAPARYFVQVGSFASVSNAGRLRDRLAGQYADIRVVPVEAGKRRYYRVRMGAFASRAEAESRAGECAPLGLPIVVVTE